ncbi:aldo/keto reductase [Paenibacillus agri]|uniref:Aldo/keto reductase n=1 Tax=Paenibacillus agri TaxID=2744309 RepID=A0A850EQR9_9BACL|nr:aldo/keto reductase [Paenibacillus agri]NUU61877.1 aldo/keto reductase [Paenibacillus agri]
MKFKNLGKTELKVSRIGLGTNAVGGHNLFHNLDESKGFHLVEKAISSGITFIDTADVYGFGRSEEMIGEVLRRNEISRNEIVLATKGSQQRQNDGNVIANNSPKYLRTALEASMKRLGTDYIDLYYIHYPDNKTSFAESIGELVRLKNEGKIREIGISNVTLEQLKEANADDQIAVLQSPYNLLDRSAENDLLPYCREHQISFIPYGPLGFGILGGKYNADFKLHSGDWRQSLPLFQSDVFPLILSKVEKLKAFAHEKQTTVANLAIAWLLAQPGIDVVIPGGKEPEQVAENLKASDITLIEEEINFIKNIFN